MGTKIHYVSGKVVELQDEEGERFWGRARRSGFRYYKSLDNKVIPFNHPTMEYIELDIPQPKAVVEPRTGVGNEMSEEETVRIEEPVTIEKAKESKSERMARQEKEFMDKANCRHKEEDGTSRRSLYYTETVNGRKYFPVCNFCGHRERYIGIPKIEQGHPLYTMEDVKQAKVYEG